MKKFMMSFVLGAALLVGTPTTSHATLGVAFSAGGAVVVGSLITMVGAGGVAATTVAAIRSKCRGVRGLTACVAGFVVSTVVTGYGLLMLDGEQEGELAFTKVSEESLAGTHFTADEIATYNRELSRLNAITQTLIAEVNANAEMDVEARWEKLGKRLSPSTLEIAAHNGQQLFETLQ